MLITHSHNIHKQSLFSLFFKKTPCKTNLSQRSQKTFQLCHFIHGNRNPEDVSLSLQDRGNKPSPDTLKLLQSSGVRPYFYFIDVHGQVFLQDTNPKNFTSCYKDPKFLNFFLGRIKPNSTTHFPEYKWQSPCGKEINFVEAADTPIVFHSLQNGQLLWAGNLQTPFLPDQLCVSNSNGRIYHPLPIPLNATKSQSDSVNKDIGSTLGLLKSSLVLSELAANLNEDTLTWQGESFRLHRVQ